MGVLRRSSALQKYNAKDRWMKGKCHTTDLYNGDMFLQSRTSSRYVLFLKNLPIYQKVIIIYLIIMSKVSLALVCDFFFPALGGVQSHIKQLAKFMKSRVENVIIITHHYEGYTGVQCIEGVKVYYLILPYTSAFNTIYFTFFLEFPEAKRILEEQKINLVHCHQTLSSLAMDYAFFAKVMGIKVIFTQHSLYGYRSIFLFYVNNFLQGYVNQFDRIICVSRAVRNNILFRTQVSPSKIIVIPNSVIVDLEMQEKTQIFDGLRQDKDDIKIVVVGRLVYRRGIDLLIELLPQLCKRNKNLKISVIGDGPKRLALRKMIQIQQLNEKIFLYGGKKHSQTLSIVKKCHILLNTSITQSFGIALVEAACLGLYVVSTNVGGIHQILPQHILYTVQPNKNMLISKIEEVMSILSQKKEGIMQNCSFKSPYLHQDCCQRIFQVYQEALQNKYLTKTQLLKNIITRKRSQILDITTLSVLCVIIVLIVMDFLINCLEKKIKINSSSQ